MKQIAIFPGTFDPITHGHLDFIKRAAALFDTLIIGVADSSRKQPHFSLEKRLAMVKKSVSDLTNIKVEQLSGRTVDFAKKHGAKTIVRGLRCASDFDYECQLAGMNRQMAPDIETVFLPATGENATISATIVREIILLGGDVSPFVPKGVLD